MKLVIIDGQGGGFGRALIAALREGGFMQEILAVGTNSAATAAMLKAGATAGATGENAVIVNAMHADWSGACKQHGWRMQPGDGGGSGRKCGKKNIVTGDKMQRAGSRPTRKAAFGIYCGCRDADYDIIIVL